MNIFSNLQTFKIARLARVFLSYFLISSLVFQNCLFASGSFEIMREDLVAPATRYYHSRKIGIVEPASQKEGAVHNAFESLSLENGMGLIFETSADTKMLYNRIYDAQPVTLSGSLQVDQALPVVLSNTGGVTLHNPELKNITDLTVAAGTMAQTDMGMAYSVDTGKVQISQTLIDEAGDLRSLSLAGRQVHIQDSLLSPLENIVVTAGRYLKGLWESCENLFLLPEGTSTPIEKSIEINKSVILRSQNITLTSLEKGAAVYLQGLLQSTSQDIVIRALGDVYLHKFNAARNLIIETTGNVYFLDDGVVGGSVRVNGKDVEIRKTVSAIQDLYLRSSHETRIQGRATSQGSASVSAETLSVNGNLSAQKGGAFSVKTFTNSGIVKLDGKGLEGTLGDFQNKGKADFSRILATIDNYKNHKNAVVRTKGAAVFSGSHYLNDGTIFTCGIHQANYSGKYEERGQFYSPTFFILNLGGEAHFTATHRSYIRDGIIQAQTLRITPGAQFEMNSNFAKSFLQFTTQSPFVFEGHILETSAKRFPFTHFFELFEEQVSLTFEDFINYVNSISLSAWKKAKGNIPSGIVLRSQTALTVKGSIDPQTSSVSLISEGAIRTEQAKLKSGYFKGNDLSARGKVAYIKDSILSSLGSEVTVNAQEEATVSNSTLWGQNLAKITGQRVVINDSALLSPSGNSQILGQESVRADRLHTQSGKESIIEGQAISIHQSQLQGEEGVHILGQDYLSLSMSSLEGELNLLRAHNQKSSSIPSTMHLKDLTANGQFVANASTISLSGKNHLSSLRAEAQHIATEGALNTTQNLTLKGATVSQMGKASAEGNLVIEASDKYIDQKSSQNISGQTLLLNAPQNTGFLGSQKAKEEAIIRLRDMHLLSLLNKTEAPTIEAHLLAGDVLFENDTVIQQNLKLWARNFENRKRLTGQGDFIAYLQQKILSKGPIQIQGRGRLSAHEDMTLQNVKAKKELEVESQGNLRLLGLLEGSSAVVKGHNIVIDRKVIRKAAPGGYRDILGNKVGVKAHAGPLLLEAENKLFSRGGLYQAQGPIDVKAKSADLPALQLHAHSQSGGDYSSSTTIVGNQFTSGSLLHLDVQNAIRMASIVLTGRDGVLIEFGRLSQRDEHNIQISHSEHTKKKRFRKKRTVSHDESHQVARSQFDGGNQGVILRIKPNGEGSLLQAPMVKGKKPLQLLSLNPHARFVILSSQNSEHHAYAKSSRNFATNSLRDGGHHYTQVFMLESESGVVGDLEGALIEIPLRSHSLVQTLESLGKGLTTAWVKRWQSNPTIDWKLVAEAHESWSRKSFGLTPGAMAVIALAITVASGGSGTGAAIGEFAGGGLLGTIATACTEALATQGVISAANNKGRMDKVFKELTHKDTLKSLGITAITAGILEGIQTHFRLDLSPEKLKRLSHFESVLHTLKKSAFQATLSSSVSAIVNKENFETAFNSALITTVVHTLGGIGAKIIGDQRNTLGSIGHKLTHAGLGGAIGAILGKGKTNAILSGAIGALVAEIVAEQIPLSHHNSGDDTSWQHFQYQRELTISLGKLSAATVSALMGLSSEISIFTADNAVRNNCILHPSPHFEVEQKRPETLARSGEMADELLHQGKEYAHQAISAIGRMNANVPFLNQNEFYQAWNQVHTQGLHLAFDFMAPNTMAEAPLYMIGGGARNLVALKAPSRSGQGLIKGLDLAGLKITTSHKFYAKAYADPKAAYSFRLDPLSFKGPMSIDSNLFTTATSYTKLGAKRNKDEFWRLWAEKYPETLSQTNIKRIAAKEAPVVDSKWLNHFPEHKNYVGEWLEHHHIDYGILTSPLPKNLHTGKGNKKVWHN